MGKYYLCKRDAWHQSIRWRPGDIAEFDYCDNHHFEELKATGRAVRFHLQHEGTKKSFSVIARDEDSSTVLYRTVADRRYYLAKRENEVMTLKEIPKEKAQKLFKDLPKKTTKPGIIFFPDEAKMLTERNNERYAERREEQVRRQCIASEPYAHLLYPDYKKLI